MIHFSCDLCGKQLRQGKDQHFVLKLEVYSAVDPAELTEDDLEPDHMDEICHLLNHIDSLQEAEEVLPTSQTRRFDLCGCCRKKFLNDPLGREVSRKLGFSEN